MQAIIHNSSMASVLEELEYPETDFQPARSTLSAEQVQLSSGEALTLKLSIPEDQEVSNAFFGTHIREAIAIVKDWAHNK